MSELSAAGFALGHRAKLRLLLTPPTAGGLHTGHLTPARGARQLQDGVGSSGVDDGLSTDTLAIVLSLTFTHDDPCQMHGVRDLGKSHHEEGQMVHRMTTTFTTCAAQLTGPSW